MNKMFKEWDDMTPWKRRATMVLANDAQNHGSSLSFAYANGMYGDRFFGVFVINPPSSTLNRCGKWLGVHISFSQECSDDEMTQIMRQQIMDSTAKYAEDGIAI